MSSTTRRRALLICGSLNQTKQMHSIARALPEFDCAFSPFYGDRTLTAMRAAGLLEGTIMGKKLQARCLAYLRDNELAVNFGGRCAPYDLAITCTDLVVPRNARWQPLVAVQEGMTDPETWLSRFVQRTRILPVWTTSTTLTGVSGRYDRFCVASEGYRKLFIERGAPADRLVVTGIPNFDNCASYQDNDLPDRGYVLLCTTDMRETFRYENRPALLKRVQSLADGRPLHIKLHPNENISRATKEIRRHCPGAVIHTVANAEHLVANCDVLVTQYSSLTYVGMALGKEVYSKFDTQALAQLLPIQNGGRSAHNIADVCRELLRAQQAPAPRASREGPGVDGGRRDARETRTTRGARDDSAPTQEARCAS